MRLLGGGSLKVNDDRQNQHGKNEGNFSPKTFHLVLLLLRLKKCGEMGLTVGQIPLECRRSAVRLFTAEMAFQEDFIYLAERQAEEPLKLLDIWLAPVPRDPPS